MMIITDTEKKMMEFAVASTFIITNLGFRKMVGYLPSKEGVDNHNRCADICGVSKIDFETMEYIPKEES